MLGEAIEKATPSDRIMIVNAAGQVIFRGYAANTESAGIRKTRRVKRYGIGMETYKATEKMWDWTRILRVKGRKRILSHAGSAGKEAGAADTEAEASGAYIHREKRGLFVEYRKISVRKRYMVL